MSAVADLTLGTGEPTWWTVVEGRRVGETLIHPTLGWQPWFTATGDPRNLTEWIEAP